MYIGRTINNLLSKSDRFAANKRQFSQGEYDRARNNDFLPSIFVITGAPFIETYHALWGFACISPARQVLISVPIGRVEKLLVPLILQ